MRFGGGISVCEGGLGEHLGHGVQERGRAVEGLKTINLDDFEGFQMTALVTSGNAGKLADYRQSHGWICVFPSEYKIKIRNAS